MSAIVKHSRDSTINLAEYILLNDHESRTCRAEILLRSGIDKIIFGDINRTRENIARHIGYKAHGDIRVLAELCAIDSVISSNVEIVKIRRHLIPARIEVIVGLLGRSKHLYIAEKPSLLDSIGCPCAGVKVASLGAEKVHRSHTELQAGTTAKIEHLIPFGHIKELLDQSLSLVHDCDEFLGTVRHLKERESCLSKIVHCIGRMLDGILTQDRRPGVEVMFLHTWKCWK